MPRAERTGIMKRKFSFDIPRLKIGPSRAETKALKDHLNASVESPPLTPKSVRPPLSPTTAAELRTACAYILQGFKPSHQIHEGQSSGATHDALEQRPGGTAFQDTVSKGLGPMSSTLVSKIHTKDRPRPSEAAPQAHDESPSENCLSRTTTVLDGHTESEDRTRIQAQRTALLARAEKLMSDSPATASAAQYRPHSRSISNSQVPSIMALRNEMMESHRVPQKGGSVETSDSTPQTDTNDYPWTTSTAPTSAAITPARSSKRTSQALLSGADGESVPKIQPVAGEWMREELEKHRQGPEVKLLQEAREQEVVAHGNGTTPTLKTQVHIPNVPVPSRKAVPRSSTDSRRAHATQYSESKIISDIQRSDNRMAQRVLRSESRQEHSLLERSQSRRAREKTISRSASQSQNASRAVTNYSRPGTAGGSRKISADISRADSRTRRSIDSFRSTVSAIAQEEREHQDKATASRWKSWKPWHRSQHSDDSLDISRPSTAGSNRGRMQVRDMQQSPKPNRTRPPLNLNRELPPLPGLEQWKPVEPSHPKYIASLSSTTIDRPKAIKRHVAQPVSGGLSGSLGSRPDDLPIQQNTPPQWTASLPSPIEIDFDSQQLVPMTTIDPASVPSAPRSYAVDVDNSRRRTQSVHNKHPPELAVMMQNTSLDGLHYSSAREKVATMPKGEAAIVMSNNTAPLVNYSRPGAPLMHSRTTSEHTNFSRKISTDDYYARMYDPRYQNMVEIPPTVTCVSDPTTRKSYGGDAASRPENPTVVATRKKKKWWPSSSSSSVGGAKMKRETTWMDHVVKSGSHSGIILTDDVAGGPIVRY